MAYIMLRRENRVFYTIHKMLMALLCACASVYVIGELSKEEDVLEWLVENKSTGDEEDVIEDVTAKTLSTLIGNIDNLVVLFCKYLSSYNFCSYSLRYSTGISDIMLF